MTNVTNNNNPDNAYSKTGATGTGSMDEVTAFYGEPISVYTRKQAIEEEVLVDVTAWASAGSGFTCPVVFTHALWSTIEGPEGDDQEKDAGIPSCEDVRGRAHDVLWIAALAVRDTLASHDYLATFEAVIEGSKFDLWAVVDGEGVTTGFPGDF